MKTSILIIAGLLLSFNVKASNEFIPSFKTFERTSILSTRWENTYQQGLAEKEIEQDCEDIYYCYPKLLKKGRKYLKRLEKKKRSAKAFKKFLSNINYIVNLYLPYKYDIDNWGVMDKWVTPYQALENGYGDCEDSAILKFFLLKDLGFKESDMRILHLINKFSTGMSTHAALAFKAGDTYYLLDNDLRTNRMMNIQEKEFKKVYHFLGYIMPDGKYHASIPNFDNKIIPSELWNLPTGLPASY